MLFCLGLIKLYVFSFKEYISSNPPKQIRQHPRFNLKAFTTTYTGWFHPRTRWGNSQTTRVISAPDWVA